LPALEDSEALVQVLHRYQPVLIEKSYLLMKRNPANAVSPGICRHVVRDGVVKLGEEVRLDATDGAPEILALDVRSSTAGTLRKVLHKLPPLYIQLRLSDGQVHRFRFIPSMGRTGFLINPLLITNVDVTQMYGAKSGRRVESFCIYAPDGAPRCYRWQIHMTLTNVPELVGGKPTIADVQRLQYPMFANYPTEADSTAFFEVQECQGRNVLLVHPDGRLVFPIPPGAREVRAEFGIMPIAYERGNSDGVQFVVEYQAAQGPSTVLFERDLDPAQRPADRGTQALTLPLPDAACGHLLLRTTNLPGKTYDWDWSYWSGVQIR
jgi:hypothetical protein